VIVTRPFTRLHQQTGSIESESWSFVPQLLRRGQYRSIALLVTAECQRLISSRAVPVARTISHLSQRHDPIAAYFNRFDSRRQAITTDLMAKQVEMVGIFCNRRSRRLKNQRSSQPRARKRRNSQPQFNKRLLLILSVPPKKTKIYTCCDDERL